MTDREILRSIGGNIRAARIKASMTQECLAELVDVHVQTIGYIEHGEFPFSITTFARLAQFLGVSPNQLLAEMTAPDSKRAERIKKALSRKRKPRSSEML